MAASSIDIATPDERDLEALAANMRAEDRAECEAATGCANMLAVVRDSFAASSECWRLRVNGSLVCVWGVVPLPGGSRGVVWMLGTDAVERFPVAFWRVCRTVVPELAAKWAVLVNAIDIRHEKAIRWGERLGFAFGAPIAHGARGMPFLPFVLVKELVTNV